ncbi:MAG TPA: DUF2993 domain-containing protein [Propionibacteriaceae bacterium]
MSPPRRSHPVRNLLIVLVVAVLLVGGLYYADGYAHEKIEARVAADLQTQLGTPTPPQVDIAGFPFLTQVVTQSIETVRVTGEDLGQQNEAQLVVSEADLTLSDVTSDDWFKTMNVAHAEGDALVGFDQLQALAGVPLTYAGGGRFEIDSTTTVLGYPVKARITGGLELNVADQTVTLSEPKVEVADVTLPDIAAKALLKAVVKPIPITGIPFGLTLTSMKVEDDGLHADLAGDNIAIGG